MSSPNARAITGKSSADRDLDAAIGHRDVAKHTEIGNGQNRNLGIDCEQNSQILLLARRPPKARRILG
jgi:hypothetical protein